VKPAQEVCDGKDNNCDGQTDEGCTCTPGTQQPCGSDTGECKKGKQTCDSSGKWGACVGEVLPATETCDGKDNNCDGTIDESLTQACYTGPSGTKGVGVCKGGTQTCSSGSWSTCAGEITPVSEVCDNQDNNCDGTVDELVTKVCYTGPSGTDGVGVCKAGTQTCTAGAWSPCAGEVTPSSEKCDNLDNDCDGTVDGVTKPCYTGPSGTQGIGLCKAGTLTCASGTWGTCSGEVTPSAEICDGQDNDCDGGVDEGATSPTMKSGVIAKSEKWVKACSPYIVSGSSVLVNSGATLTIEPGVTVKFDGFYRIQVEGALVAIGTSSEKIVFTSNKSSPQAGDWQALLFQPSSIDAVVDANDNYKSGSIIKHCEIAYGGPIQADQSSPYISDNYIHHVSGPPPRDWPTGTLWLEGSSSIVKNNTITDNQISGIVTGGIGGAPKILNNTIKNNIGGGGWGGGLGLFGDGGLIKGNTINGNVAFEQGGGIAAYRGKWTIENNLITNNTCKNTMQSDRGGGAIGSWSSNLTIRYNVISNNKGTTAIHFDCSIASLKMNNNNITGNPTTYDVYIHNTTSSGLDASNNYWGTTSVNTIIPRIYGYHDAFGVPRVTLTPLAAAPIPSAGP
jgi:parallel beta-helix repeat protein